MSVSTSSGRSVRPVRSLKTPTGATEVAFVGAHGATQVAHGGANGAAIGADRPDLAWSSMFSRQSASPLVWGLESMLPPDTLALIRQLWRLAEAPTPRGLRATAADLEAWLGAVGGRPIDVALAIECLAWGYASAQLAGGEGDWSGGAAGRLAEFLKQSAEESAVQSPAGLERQLLATELEYLGVIAAGHDDGADRRLAAARQSLRSGLAEAVDAAGAPLETPRDFARGLLACWTRCRRLSRLGKDELFDADARSRFDRFVGASLRMTRHDGAAVLTNVPPARHDRALLSEAVAAGDDVDNLRMCELLASPLKAPPGRSSGRGAKGRKKTARPKAARISPLPALQSEKSQFTVMRTGWDASAQQLAVACDDLRMMVEWNVGRRTLLAGEWTWEASVDGAPLQADGQWEEVCWSNDDLTDYLEMELPLTGGWRLQRQIVLPRQEGFALFTQIVLAPDSLAAALATTALATTALATTSRLPMGPDVEFAPAEETREGQLQVDGRSLAAALPLALPEWRSDADAGELRGVDRNLELRQSLTGRNLYAPLLIDADPRRARKQLTWRRLAVGEQLQNQPRDVAVGFRAQSDDRQWLIYRALAAKANRTVLGKNLCWDFYLGRFLSTGTTESVIEIE